MKCAVCGTKCRVSRNVPGPHSYTESLARAYSGGKATMSIKDVFSCPYAEKKWHEKACGLADEMFETNSDRVKAMIKADIEELVAKNLHKESKVQSSAARKINKGNKKPFKK
jgi:accessory colonization factor AcfC